MLFEKWFVITCKLFLKANVCNFIKVFSFCQHFERLDQTVLAKQRYVFNKKRCMSLNLCLLQYGVIGETKTRNC